MVHCLSQNRFFLAALAALMLLAFMPWQGALHCQGGSAASGGTCCCCLPKEVPTMGTCCCAPGARNPGDRDPCPCIQLAKAVGLPPVISSEDSAPAATALHPDHAPIIANVPGTGAVRIPEPPARNGPLLHLRLQVLLS